MNDTTTNNAAREERRAQMLEKVRKLLAMAKDGRGNSTKEDQDVPRGATREQ